MHQGTYFVWRILKLRQFQKLGGLNVPLQQYNPLGYVLEWWCAITEDDLIEVFGVMLGFEGESSLGVSSSFQRSGKVRSKAHECMLENHKVNG